MDIELPKLHKAITEKGHDIKIADHVIELIKPFVGYGCIMLPPCGVNRIE